jgi:hypothetical protein
VTRNDWRQLFARRRDEQPEQLWTLSAPPENKGEIGEEARKLLDNPVLQLALTRVEEKLVATWKTTAAGEDDAREAAYNLLWGLKQFKGELGLMIAEAGMAAREKPQR